MLAILAFLLCMMSSPAWAQAFALSFDDGFDTRKQPDAAKWNRQLLDALSDAKAKSIFFPAAGRIDNAEGLALVRAWGDAGNVISNHTYTHPNLNAESISAKDFIADIERADALLRQMPGWSPKLRFPYLKEGATAAERDAVRDWMRQRGYRPAPPSIDTSDWYYNQRYLDLLSKCTQCELTPIKQAYLDHLWDRAQYYDGLARKLLGRSPRHVVLLHTNAINARFLPDIIEMFRSRGWRLIDPKRAYRDPLYRMKPNALPAGESIVWALAKERGYPDLRYPAEDSVYEKPELERLGL